MMEVLSPAKLNETLSIELYVSDNVCISLSSFSIRCCPTVLLYSLQAGGKICLEGTICEDYYRVRQLLYEQFAII